MNLTGAMVPTVPRIAGFLDKSGGPSTASGGITGDSEVSLSGSVMALSVSMVVEGRLALLA